MIILQQSVFGDDPCVMHGPSYKFIVDIQVGVDMLHLLVAIAVTSQFQGLSSEQ